ncbi:hypothetical protein Bca4012_010540 [Brassica carinata]
MAQLENKHSGPKAQRPQAETLIFASTPPPTAPHLHPNETTRPSPPGTFIGEHPSNTSRSHLIPKPTGPPHITTDLRDHPNDYTPTIDPSSPTSMNRFPMIDREAEKLLKCILID